MLLADDMRPEMGVYAKPGSYARSVYAGIRTPHLDSLAARSMLLHRAYSQASF